MTYYPNGAIAGFTYGNGIVHTLTQNARGLPDRSQDLNGSTPVHDDSYIYDQVGNVAAIADAVAGNRGDRTMTYDNLNRLTQVTGDNGPSLMFGTASYSYDALDNLTHVGVTGGSQARDQTYVYDAHNRLTNVMAGGVSVIGLGYDAQGNLANKNGVFYTFDYGNRLRAGGPETYRYDVQGRRVRSINSTGQVIYSLYAQSGQLLFQRDERSGKRRQYIYLGGSLVAESDLPLVGTTATVTYQHTDALGSPVAITNSSRTVTERREYEPYGYQTTPTLQDGPSYTGHVADAATGMIYMQQRYYDPLIGQRFLTVDPVTAYSPGGAFNQYWYAKASPYGFTDRDGRDPGRVYGDPDACNEVCWQERRRDWKERISQIKRNEAKARHGQLSNEELGNLAEASVGSLGTSSELMKGTVYLAQGGVTPPGGTLTNDAAQILKNAKYLGRASGVLGGLFGAREALTGKTGADKAHGALNFVLAGVGLVACNAICGAGLAIYGVADTIVQFQTYTDPGTGQTYSGWTALKHDWTD